MKYREGDILRHRQDPRVLVVRERLSNNRLLVNFLKRAGKKNQPDWEVYSVDCKPVEV
jgi:hypothetical protein